MSAAALGPACWREDCDQPRLRYGHACPAHDPLYVAPPPTRCQLPLRCYCPATPLCLGHESNQLRWQRPDPATIATVYQLAARRQRERTPA